MAGGSFGWRGNVSNPFRAGGEALAALTVMIINSRRRFKPLQSGR